MQNDISNDLSPTTIIAPITSKTYDKKYPTNVFMKKKYSKLDKDSTILLNQIRTIDKSRIVKRISQLNQFIMYEVELAINVSLQLN